MRKNILIPSCKTENTANYANGVAINELMLYSLG